jgi:hypothetical protein
MRLIFINKTKINGKNPESGFVLIAAIMGIMILLAVGFLALTISSSDLRIAGRLVGERKAFSAAESGVNEVLRQYDFYNPGNIYWTKVDPLRDPNPEFSAPAPSPTGNTISLPGYGYGTVSQEIKTTVTGRDTSYASQVRISIGVATKPAPGGTEQGPF